MEQYDYTQTPLIGDDISIEIDRFNNRQLKELKEDVDRIKREERLENRKNGNKWFDSALLPVLKDFAELTASLLEIERDDNGIITVAFRNKEGIDITESCKYMRIALFAASNISVDCDDEKAILALVFDCNNFAN